MFDPRVIEKIEINQFVDISSYFNLNTIKTSYYNRRVDYIFMRNIKPIYYNVDQTNRISDHFPILCNFL